MAFVLLQPTRTLIVYAEDLPMPCLLDLPLHLAHSHFCMPGVCVLCVCACESLRVCSAMYVSMYKLCMCVCVCTHACTIFRLLMMTTMMMVMMTMIRLSASFSVSGFTCSTGPCVSICSLLLLSLSFSQYMYVGTHVLSNTNLCLFFGWGGHHSTHAMAGGHQLFP